jgi:hypothetical protein
MLAIAPVAQAQNADALASTLAEGVRCEDGGALTDLNANLAKVSAAAAELVTGALTTLAADQAICAPVRDAAVTLLAGPGTPAEANSSDPDQARALVDATLAEADRRSAAMKFEVGPPPLNLSRGRRSGS